MAAEIVEGTGNPLPADGKTKACYACGKIKTGQVIGQTDDRLPNSCSKGQPFAPLHDLG